MRLEQERTELRERGIRAAKRRGNYTLVEVLQGKGDCCDRGPFWPHEIVSTIAISKDYEKILPEVLGRAPISVEAVNDIPEELRGTSKGLLYAVSARILSSKAKEVNPYLENGEEIAKVISSFPDTHQRAIVASYLMRSLQGKDSEISLEGRMKRISSRLTRDTLDNVRAEKSDSGINGKDEHLIHAYRTILNAASGKVLGHLVEEGEILGKTLDWKDLYNLDALIEHTDRFDLPATLSEMKELYQELGDDYDVSYLKDTFREVLKWRDPKLVNLVAKRLKEFSTPESKQGDHRSYSGLRGLVEGITNSKTLKRRGEKLESLFATLSMAQAGEGRISHEVYEQLGESLKYHNAHEVFTERVRAVTTIMEELPANVSKAYLHNVKHNEPVPFLKAIDQWQVKNVLRELDRMGTPDWAYKTIGFAATSGDEEATSEIAEKVEILSKTNQDKNIYRKICKKSTKYVNEDRHSLGHYQVDTDSMLAKLEAATSETSIEVFRSFPHKRYSNIRDSYISTLIHKPEFSEAFGSALLGKKNELKNLKGEKLTEFKDKIFEGSYMAEFTLRRMSEPSELVDRVRNYTVTEAQPTPLA